MISDFNFLINKIISSDKLLPGPLAQRKMSPLPVNEDRFFFQEQSQIRNSAVLIALINATDNVYIPLIQRPVYKGAHSGQISLPGGRKEPEDVDLKATALREAMEEISLDPTKVKILRSMTKLYVPASKHMIFPFLGYIDHEVSLKPDKKEVDEILCWPVNDLFKETEWTIFKQYGLKVPYFNYKDKIIWGATAMILSELKELITLELSAD